MNLWSFDHQAVFQFEGDDEDAPIHSDYLPLSLGDSGFFQPDGFASFAGQTKKPQLTLGLFNRLTWFQ